MSKRNCRMTDEERTVHDRAVSIRKMTDKQICDFIDRQYSLGMNEGTKAAKLNSERPASGTETIDKFITYLETKRGSGNGIGGGTLYRLRKEAESYELEAARE